jgi:hypothetical protein
MFKKKSLLSYAKIIDDFLKNKKGIEKINLEGKQIFSKAFTADSKNSVLNLIYNNEKVFDNIFSKLQQVCKEKDEFLDDKYKNKKSEDFLYAFRDHSEEVLDYLYDSTIAILLEHKAIDEETKMYATSLFHDKGYIVKETSLSEDINGEDLHIFKEDIFKKVQVKSSSVKMENVDKIILSPRLGGMDKIKNVDFLVIFERSFDKDAKKNIYKKCYVINVDKITGIQYEQNCWVITTLISDIETRSENDLKNVKKNYDHSKSKNKTRPLFKK